MENGHFHGPLKLGNYLMMIDLNEQKLCLRIIFPEYLHSNGQKETQNVLKKCTDE